jgi:Outer membrane protein beta-barrel domain
MFTLKRHAGFSAVLTVVGLMVAVASPARAQGGVNLTPWFGIYVPTKNSFSDVNNAVFERDVSVMGGARLTFWGTGRLGFEATGGYAPAKISGETINETNTNVLAAAGRLLFAVTPVTDPVSFYLAAGPALVTRGKDPFDNDASNTKFGGNLGAGLRFALGESGRTALRLDLEDYLYNGDFGGGDDEFQNDLVASLGLSISLGGRADDTQP